MTQSIGLGVINISAALNLHKPDLVLIIGDRYEALSVAISSACQNIPLAHLQGGEVSGSIDESIRHAITKLAHLHFPATDRAEHYIINMGENPKYVFNFGCPSADYIHAIEIDTITKDINSIEWAHKLILRSLSCLFDASSYDRYRLTEKRVEIYFQP